MIFLILGCLVGATVQIDLSLMYSHVSEKYRCVTNSSSALSWIGTNITENYVSVFLPPRKNDTDIDIFQTVQEPWVVQTSTQGNVSKLILDRRWEELELHVTQPQQYKMVLSNLTETFTIPFSLRVKNDAHIFLCDGDDVQNDNCYWFLLQAYGGRKSATRECRQNTKTTLKNNCFIDLNVKYHPEDYPKYLSEEVWSHFTLENNAGFKLYHGESVLLDFKVWEPINVTYMFVSSKSSIGFWKIHETDYLYTEQEVQEFQLGPVITPIGDSVCLSMFVSMCASCSLKVILWPRRFTFRAQGQTSEAKEGEWQEVKFFVDNLQSDWVELAVSTRGRRSGLQFWAIDRVRQGQQNEYRMISVSKQATCHLTTDKKQSVQMSFNEVEEIIHSKCSEDLLDHFCSTCFWLLDDEGGCNKSKTCTRAKSSLECSCSTGFYSSEECIYMCIEGHGNTGCARKCENDCTKDCGMNDGTCKKCRNLYSGRACSIKASSVLVPVIAGVVATIVVFSVALLVALYVTKRIRFKAFFSISPQNSQPENEDGDNTLVMRRPKQVNDVYVTSKPIEVAKFYDYVKTAFINNEIEPQCLAVLKNMPRKSYAAIPSNIVLDYVDLCYNDYTRIPKAYLATTFPKDQQYEDFWKLVWEEDVKYIVLLDNDQATNEIKYWPEKNPIAIRSVTIQMLSKKIWADYEHRKFALKYKNSVRQVDHYRLTSWLHADIPFSTQNFVPFFQKISKLPLSPDSPLLVHCRFSPVGAGFFLLCDINLRTANRDGVVNVLESFHRLAWSSTNFVDEDSGYYLLAHLIIIDCFFALDTTISHNSFTKSKINQDVAYLHKTTWLDTTMQNIRRDNRIYFRVLPPTEGGRMKLVSYSPEQMYDSYVEALSAVHVDGFKSSNKFIVTKAPTNATFEIFWSAVETKHVSVVVFFSELNQPCDCWPNEKYPEMYPSQSVTLKHISTDKWMSWDQITLELRSKITKARTITILMFKDWVSKSSCPRNVGDFVKFCTMSQGFLKTTNPVVVASLDGVTASGLYLAMLYIMNKMALETICDVCVSVRIMRSYKDTFLQKKEQLYFLYEAAKVYLEEVVKNKNK